MTFRIERTLGLSRLSVFSLLAVSLGGAVSAATCSARARRHRWTPWSGARRRRGRAARDSLGPTMNAMPPRAAAESAAGRPAPSAVSERPGAAPPTAETGPGALPPGRTSPPSAGGTEPETPSRRRRRRRLRWLLVAAVALLAAGGGAYAWLQASQAPNLANAASEPEPMSPGEFRLSDAEMRALRIEEVQSAGVPRRAHRGGPHRLQRGPLHAGLLPL